MNKKNIHLEKYWENMYQLHGTHPNVDDETSRELKRKGFFAGCHLWYDFERHDPSLYVNDRAMCYLHPINGWLSKLIDDKRFCPLLFRNRPHLIPELSIGIEDGVAKYVLENGVMRRSDLPLRKLFHMYCGKYGELLGKPAGLSGGAGIFLIGPEHIERAASQIDHKHAYLINNRLNNEEYAQRINPYGLNTIRCYFFRGKDGIKILTIVHRFGTSGSKYVDNVSAGGIACRIDPETGRFSSGFSPMEEQVRMDYHSESNVRLTGFTVPNWSEKLLTIFETLDNLSFVDFAACDLGVTDQGIKLLEVNSLPSRRLMQFDGPALVNLEFRDFLRTKGYPI